MNFWQLISKFILPRCVVLYFGSPPKPPKPPTPELSEEEKANERKRRMAARGMSSTILTGGQGILSQAPVSRTTLTGM